MQPIANCALLNSSLQCKKQPMRRGRKSYMPTELGREILDHKIYERNPYLFYYKRDIENVKRLFSYLFAVYMILQKLPKKCSKKAANMSMCVY